MILKSSSPQIIGALLSICKYLIAFSVVSTLGIAPEASVMSAFPYQPLSEGQIRILEIAPGGTYDTLDCCLIYANLGEEQITPYEALSYHWGEGSIPIVVDGHQFNVTANLYSALIHLRDTTQSRRIWIDAICLYFDRSRIRHLRSLTVKHLFREELDLQSGARLSSEGSKFSLQ
jgi:hypothetical protein